MDLPLGILSFPLLGICPLEDGKRSADQLNTAPTLAQLLSSCPSAGAAIGRGFVLLSVVRGKGPPDPLMGYARRPNTH